MPTRGPLNLLLEELPRIEEKHAGNRQFIEIGISSAFLLLAFGREWYERKIAFRDDAPDPWMMNGSDCWLSRVQSTAPPVRSRWFRASCTNGIWIKTAKTGDVRRLVYSHRVVRLANALFTVLLGEANGMAKGFGVLRDRLRGPDTKSSFVEPK